jgi:hypothetical protein
MGEDKADQFPLVCRQGSVPQRDGPAEKGDWVLIL